MSASLSFRINEVENRFFVSLSRFLIVDAILLALIALGVVFGDIGTSPLYALRECFSYKYGIEADRENILGILSLGLLVADCCYLAEIRDLCDAGVIMRTRGKARPARPAHLSQQNNQQQIQQGCVSAWAFSERRRSTETLC